MKTSTTLSTGKHYEKELTTVLLDNLAEDEAEDAQALAHACARNEPAAMEKVNDVLASIGLTINGILNRSQVHKAEELAQRYARREPARGQVDPKTAR